MNKLIITISLLCIILMVGCSNSTITGKTITEKTLKINDIKLSEHNSADNCWVVYDGSYYDITPMIATGKHKPVDYLCGTDITKSFDSGRHAGYDEQKLGKYLVE